MAGEYGIERGIILPNLPGLYTADPALKRLFGDLKEYLRKEREAVVAAYDELAKRLNEFPYEAHWGSETPAEITAGQNNYQLGDAIVHRLSTDASWTISGFVAPLVEQFRALVNVGGNDIVIAHDSGGSATANKVITVSGANVTFGANAWFMMWYDLATARWRQIVV